MNNPNIFLENLKNLDLAYVSDKVVEKISLIIISNPNLDVENLQNYSTAAHSLFIWLTNIIKTHHLSKKVELYKKDNNMKEETFKNQKQTVKSQNEGIMGNEKNLIQETSKEKSLQNINTNTEEIEENNNISKIDENDILKEMLPLMQKAKEILNSLDKRGIAEIKAMRKLPQKISLVLQCLSILFGCTHEQEQDVRAILHDINFLNRLAQFDLNEISDDRIKNLALFFDSNPELTIPTINALSQFASQIFKWILTICRCHYFFKLLQVNKPQNFSEKKSNQIVEEKKPDTIKTVTEIYEYENEPFEKTQDLIDEKVLKDTINELNNLDKEVLSQLNLYVKPPNIIGLTMTLVCMVLQNDSEKITKV